MKRFVAIVITLLVKGHDVAAAQTLTEAPAHSVFITVGHASVTIRSGIELRSGIARDASGMIVANGRKAAPTPRPSDPRLRILSGPEGLTQRMIVLDLP